MSKKKKQKEDDPKIHGDLQGFNIHIDEFGQVHTTLSQEELNSFLNEKLDDKKFSSEVKGQLGNLYEEE